MKATEARLRWWRGLPDERDGSPAAWLTSMAEAASTLARPDPDAADLRDARTHPPEARADFLVRRGLLRCLAARHLGLASQSVSIGYDAVGAPRLQAPRSTVHVSAAHRDGWLAMAVAPQPIGIDLELVGASADPAWAMLADAERRWLEALPSSTRSATFLRLWTAKEAYLKALGLGLDREPSTVVVTLTDEDRFVVEERGRDAKVSIARHRVEVIDGQPIIAACVVLSAEGRSRRPG